MGGEGAAGAAAMPALVAVDENDSDDEERRELDYHEDSALLQELIGREITYAKNRGDVPQHLGYTAIARYHAFITDPYKRKCAALSLAPTQAARSACAATLLRRCQARVRANHRRRCRARPRGSTRLHRSIEGGGRGPLLQAVEPEEEPQDDVQVPRGEDPRRPQVLRSASHAPGGQAWVRHVEPVPHPQP